MADVHKGGKGGRRMKAIIAAAGTGGHINPGIAIANEIKRQEPDSQIIFLGTTRGLENDLVPRAGYELKHINAYGFNRSLSWENIKKIWQTFCSVGEVRKIIQQEKPDIVIGTGGYICVAAGMAAKQLKVPLVLHESNAFPGMAVKLLSKKANCIFLGFAEAKNRLPKAKRTVVTGTPTKVKKVNISPEQKEQIQKRLGFKRDLPIVLAFGGSQGAKSINDSLIQIIEEQKNQKYNLIWSAGAKGYEELKEKWKEKIDSYENAKVVPYIYNMEELYNAVDLVVCRSGAMTVTEIMTVGKPAIFIPFPFATENHQEYNAKVLADKKAAKIILDKELTAEKLNKEIENLIRYPQILKEMGITAEKIAKKDVEKQIYEEMKKILAFL